MIYNTYPIATVNINDEATVYIYQTIEDTFILEWNDGVVNEWKETYPTLSQALTRTAVLAACGESGWGAGFTTTEPALFTKHAEKFLSKQITQNLL